VRARAVGPASAIDNAGDRRRFRQQGAGLRGACLKASLGGPKDARHFAIDRPSMLSFFRRLLRSRYGTPITVGFLILLMAGFGIQGFTNFTRETSLHTNDIASVNGVSISPEDVRGRVQQTIESARQQNPDINTQQFLAEGGLEQTVESMETGLALEQFADNAGLIVSKRLIDGEIASVPAFRGLDGKFDQARYNQLLQTRGFTDASLRSDIKRQALSQWIVSGPTARAYMPAQVALPYAQMLLEHRTGSAVLVPATAMPAGSAPSDQQLGDYYKAHQLRYTLPERRVFRYALVTPEQVKVQATPSDAELQAAYKAGQSKYAPVEKRTIKQLIVLDQNTANGIAAKIKGGTAIDAAAKAAGLSAATIKDVTKPALATQTSQALADAAFAGAKGTVIGPLKSSLGWHIAVVDAITNNPGTSFEQARPELVTQVTTKKTGELLAQMAESVDSSTTGSTFDEIIKDNKLTPATSPALLATGVNPDDPKSTADPKMAPLIKAAFAMAANDDPSVVQADKDGSFAVVKLDRIVAAAPRPLAAIKDQVAKDYQLDHQLQLAGETANKIANAVKGGASLEAAIAASGAKLPAPEKLDLTRGQALNSQQLPPQGRMLFSVAPKQARRIDAPNRTGYIVVYTAEVQTGNLASQPQIVLGAQQQLGRVAQQELPQELLTAIRKLAKIARNDAAVQKLRGELGGTAAQ
jgi:peptidyl-prolyl cis-trans isomerase D